LRPILPQSIHSTSTLADSALTDAAVWALEPHRLNESQGYEPVFPPLNAASLQDMVRPAIKGEDTSKVAVLAASPLEIDLRMFVQQGQFTIHVTDEPLNQMQVSNNWLKKIRIPATAIGEIAKQLDLLGVRLADVFAGPTESCNRGNQYAALILVASPRPLTNQDRTRGFVI
jgi:hypothetical protein